jgi:membrane fusion protein, multidrug efflux system
MRIRWFRSIDPKLRSLLLKTRTCIFRFLPLFIMLLVLVCPASCRKENAQSRKRSVPVSAAAVSIEDVPLQLAIIGNVEAFSTVSVKAQVNGMLIKVHFKEGDFVKKGDVLFNIDDRPYQEAYEKSKADREGFADLVREAEANYQKALAQEKQENANLNKAIAQERQARANMEKDQAQAANAAQLAKRYAYLLEKGFATQEQNDNFQTQLVASKATVKADEQAIENARAAVEAEKASIENAHASAVQSAASIETARARMHSAEAQMKSAAIDLGYCTIRSPLDGRTGSLLIHEGNIIKAQDTASLVVINRITPVYVDFSVPERYLEEIKKYRASKRLAVKAKVQDRDVPPETGYVDFIDNAVDITTGTIRIKGTFANRKHLLWPGQFVNVTLTLTTIKNAVIVPARAVLEGQDGTYVYIVKGDKTARYVPVKTGVTNEGNTVILEGLKEGDQVITDGQLGIKEGTELELKAPGGGDKQKGKDR